ncbi:MerR family transcriptional regulator [Streptomyces sp. NPDC017993]|uniref:helix-turn-helix domain-containing protein n=1 Tax=Streptomyces sp. NPDC017993 TaxID=3365027 RepID=UPI00379FD2F5
MHVPDDTFWTIGEIARKAGLTVKLVRHWSDIGVIAPAGRTAAGYRLYDAEALARLQLTRTMLGLGLGLSTIKDVLERGHTMAEMAATHIDALETHHDCDRHRGTLGVVSSSHVRGIWGITSSICQFIYGSASQLQYGEGVVAGV